MLKWQNVPFVNFAFLFEREISKGFLAHLMQGHCQKCTNSEEGSTKTWYEILSLNYIYETTSEMQHILNCMIITYGVPSWKGCAIIIYTKKVSQSFRIFTQEKVFPGNILQFFFVWEIISRNSVKFPWSVVPFSQNNLLAFKALLHSNS